MEKVWANLNTVAAVRAKRRQLTHAALQRLVQLLFKPKKKVEMHDNKAPSLHRLEEERVSAVEGATDPGKLLETFVA